MIQEAILGDGAVMMYNLGFDKPNLEADDQDEPLTRVKTW